MTYTFGFIGVGHMGSALAKAAAKRVPGGKIMISDSSQSRISAVAGELGCATGTATQVVGGSKYVFIGVKPQNMSELFKEILPVLAHKKERTVLVSMAAGVTTERLTELAGTDVPVIRIMPNTPVEVEEGCVLYTCAGGVTEEETVERCVEWAPQGLLSGWRRGLSMQDALSQAAVRHLFTSSSWH